MSPVALLRSFTQHSSAKVSRSCHNLGTRMWQDQVHGSHSASLSGQLSAFGPIAATCEMRAGTQLCSVFRLNRAFKGPVRHLPPCCGQSSAALFSWRSAHRSPAQCPAACSGNGAGRCNLEQVLKHVLDVVGRHRAGLSCVQTQLPRKTRRPVLPCASAKINPCSFANSCAAS